MKELSLEAIDFAKALIEGKVTVLSIHDHRIAELSEVESDLMHASGGDLDAEESGLRELFDNLVPR